MARHTFKNGPSIAVRCHDPATGKSLSITVDCSDLGRVAEFIERALRRQWYTTSLTDRRHKRRF